MAEPYYAGDLVTLHHGDCMDVMAGMPDASVDAVVCDPPYGLAEIRPETVVAALAAWLGGDRMHVPDGRGFMGREWDRFVPPPGVWDECRRVLKPGGHLLAFAAPRTADLMGLSIRLASFSVVDSISWVTGQGFPKAKSRLKPAHEPIVMARRPAKADSPLPGLDVCRVATDWENDPNKRGWQGGNSKTVGVTGNFGCTGDRVAQPNDAGRWPPNLLLVHDARCQPAGTRRVRGSHDGGKPIAGTLLAGRVFGRAGREDVTTAGFADADGLETVQAFTCAPGCPVAGLDEQSGTLKSGDLLPGHKRGQGRHANDGGYVGGGTIEKSYGGDTGGASRFFPQFTWDPEHDLPFMYCAKAPKSERPRLPDGTSWCTVKPLSLIRWLVRLVTPPGGLVLDPFAGTGTTGQACALEGFRCVLAEQDPAAAELARVRLRKPAQQQLTLT